MNIIRDGVKLIVYEFVLFLTYVFLSAPVAAILSSLTNAGTSMGVTQMAAEQTLINQVLSICWAIAGFIPIIIFCYLAMTTNMEEYEY